MHLHKQVFGSVAALACSDSLHFARLLRTHRMVSFVALTLWTVCAARFVGFADSQSASPCPRLFTYEPRRDDEPDRWYGIVTLLSDTELTGIWLRVLFDKPSVQLGNWFGQVSRRGEAEYSIKKPGFTLKANTPHTVRIFVRYDVGGDVPRLTGFRLNAKTVCPENGGTAATTTEAPALQTSDDLGATTTTTRRPPPPEVAPPSDVDDYPTSDFNRPFEFFVNQTQRPVQAAAAPPATCGVVAVEPTPLITYGQTTYEGQFPWHAALYHVKNIDLTYVCGGSLISDRHVLTVAHCVTRQRTSAPINPTTLVVYLGKFYLRRWSGSGLQDREVERIVVHPDYDSQTFANDIAAVKMSKRADYTVHVRPICVWSDAVGLDVVLDVLGTVVGWGFDETGKLTEQLTSANMPVVSQTTCLYSYPEFFSRFTSNKTFCAGFLNGTSVCNGDSGGGMAFLKSGVSAPTWQLRGLVSISVALQNQFKCDSGYYVVFTDVAQYLGWIKGAMGV